MVIDLSLHCTYSPLLNPVLHCMGSLLHIIKDTRVRRCTILMSSWASGKAIASLLYYVSRGIAWESGLSYDPTLEATNRDSIKSVIHSIGTTRNPMHTSPLTQTICIALMYVVAQKSIFPRLILYHKIPQVIVSIYVACIPWLYGNQTEMLVLHWFIGCNRSASMHYFESHIKLKLHCRYYYQH
jgi:hypothetical protein